MPANRNCRSSRDFPDRNTKSGREQVLKLARVQAQVLVLVLAQAQVRVLVQASESEQAHWLRMNCRSNIGLKDRRSRVWAMMIRMNCHSSIARNRMRRMAARYSPAFGSNCWRFPMSRLLGRIPFAGLKNKELKRSRMNCRSSIARNRKKAPCQ